MNALNLSPYSHDSEPLVSATDLILESFPDTTALIEQRRPDSPIYCFSPEQLRKRVELFIKGFPGKVGFAVKSNGKPVVLDQLVKSGIHFFDAASVSEIALVRQLDPNATIFYDNPIKSDTEIRKAYFQYGVRSFVLDDEIELNKIRAIIGHDSSVQLTVRFKIEGDYAAMDLNTKFGAEPAAASRLLSLVDEAGYKPALTFHPGSQCYTPTAYRDFIDAAAGIARTAGVQIVMLNVGGGFPAHYRNSAIPPLDAFFSAIESAFNRWFSSQECELVCEPGRSLVASSCSLLCRVKHRRQGATLFLNDGIYGGFQEQFVAYFELPTKVYREGRILLDTPDEFTIYGPTCDSSDCFTEKLLLPASIQTGDWIEFGLTGAYGSATTTRFNGYSSDHYVMLERATHF